MQRKLKKGETLIEVLIAVALFSVTAISAVGIMNHGINNTQASLETTMARTEIDAQAESLRFIHDSYVAGKNTDTFGNAWNTILDKLAINPPEEDAASLYEDITNCSTVYNPTSTSKNTLVKNRAFIVNPRNLNDGTLSSNRSVVVNEQSIENREVTPDSNLASAKFDEAPINPRILFVNAKEDTPLYDTTTDFTEVNRVEGIWVIAVRDHAIDEDEDDHITSVNYLDFYIHTCWNTPGRLAATNISTTIRLHNPAAITTSESHIVDTHKVTYMDGGETIHVDSYSSAEEYTIRAGLEREGKIFVKWEADDGASYSPGDHPPASLSGNLTLHAVWNDVAPETTTYCLKYKTDLSNTKVPNNTCVTSAENEVYIPITTDVATPTITPFDYRFEGWYSSASGGSKYETNATIRVRKADSCDGSHTVCVHAHWARVANRTADFSTLLEWGNKPSDLDSWVYSPSWRRGPVYYGHMSNTVAALEYDFLEHGSPCTYFGRPALDWSISGNCSEVVTINASKSETNDAIYFSVWVYDDYDSKIYSDTRVVLTQRLDDGNTVQYNFPYNADSGKYRCWNVFAIRNQTEVIKIDQVYTSREMKGDQSFCAKADDRYNLNDFPVMEPNS